MIPGKKSGSSTSNFSDIRINLMDAAVIEIFSFWYTAMSWSDSCNSFVVLEKLKSRALRLTSSIYLGIINGCRILIKLKKRSSAHVNIVRKWRLIGPYYKMLPLWHFYIVFQMNSIPMPKQNASCRCHGVVCVPIIAHIIQIAVFTMKRSSNCALPVWCIDCSAFNRLCDPNCEVFYSCLWIFCKLNPILFTYFYCLCIPSHRWG